MSLPPGFLEELRTRTSLAQVVGRKVVWDTRKSNQGKGDLWAPCPFHQEKTASFHVDDRKGFYYCFGCHAKGDAITFLREAENMEFMEAVKVLAADAGMTVPDRDPRAQERSDRRSELVKIMEAAVRFYRMTLKSGAGAAARDYLEGRRLGPEAQDRWELGFAPEGWQGLRDHLKGQGVSDADMLEAGLVRQSDRGRAPYDTFRGRVMFPIRDARGRAIAFGGRALDPGDNAKYINSPETPLFDKGRTLYNHGPAREAAAKGQPLILAEGYMDVIALAEAGFGAAVAPLGTAITEDQLRLAWRIADEPVMALDGDKAGFNAALRAIDTALPLIEAGKSLRFALLPTGKDPDDLLRESGAQAMRKVLDEAQPMVALLWRRETEGQSFDSPERRAALDRRLRESIRVIQDPSLKHHYGEELKRLRWELFRPAKPVGREGFAAKKGAPSGATSEARASALAAADAPFEEVLKEALILAILVRRPHLLDEVMADIERLDCSRAAHEQVRLAILMSDDATPEELEAKIGPEPLEKLFSHGHVRLSPGLAPGASDEVARMALAEELAKLFARRGARREIEEATEIADHADEGMTWRLKQVAESLGSAGRPAAEDGADFDVAPNGARLDRDERRRLDSLLSGVRYEKGSRRTP